MYLVISFYMEQKQFIDCEVWYLLVKFSINFLLFNQENHNWGLTALAFHWNPGWFENIPTSNSLVYTLTFKKIFREIRIL